MAIRIRAVDGVCIALCAAETDAEPGDVYIDDGQHYALTAKFSQDYRGQTMLTEYPTQWAAMETQKKRDARETIEAWLASAGVPAVIGDDMSAEVGDDA